MQKLNEAQLKWVCQKQNDLIHFCEARMPLKDSDWIEIMDYVNKTIELAKGKTTDFRQEVRVALFDVIEVYEYADAKMIELRKKYGTYESSLIHMMAKWSQQQKEWFDGVGKNHG